MFRLELLSLTCNQTEDRGTPRDEPRMTVNGAWVFGPGDMNEGDVVNLAGRSETFINNALVSLVDVDTPGADDFIGSVTVVGANDVNQGERTVTLGGSDGEYELMYYVVLA